MTVSISRRQFIKLMGIASVAGIAPTTLYAKTKQPNDPYEIPAFGQVRLLHLTDCHAQLLPAYYREPNVNLGVGELSGKIPYIVGKNLLKQFGIQPTTRDAHAFTHLNYVEAALKYGKVGGFAHLATLIKRLRESYGRNKTLLLDSGDTWQGSGTAYWTHGQDMVGACNLLGVDVMTGHWEFTYQAEEVLANVKEFKGEFIAQNISVKEEALLAGVTAFDKSGHIFKPYTIKELNGVKVAIIGQAFPYTPITNPARFIPQWTFGIRDSELQNLVTQIRTQEKPALVVLLSHSGMSIDLTLAAKISGIDVILGGHSHLAMPRAIKVKNDSGITLVCHSGAHGKFLGVLDIAVKEGKLKDYKYRLLPVFANLIPADKELQAYIDKVRAPYLKQLTEKLAVADQLLYRRGNFNGTFDQLIGDALRIRNDAQIALSPGFRWGTAVLPNESITFEDVLNQTCINYPETYVRELTGQALKTLLEEAADNLFNPNPYLQQGCDMVKVSGMNYVCDPTQPIYQRISQMTLTDGTAIDMTKPYKVAGWAAVNSSSAGKPIWEVVAEYLRERKTIKLDKMNTVNLLNIKDNAGIADYPYLD